MKGNMEVWDMWAAGERSPQKIYIPSPVHQVALEQLPDVSWICEKSEAENTVF